MRRYLRDGVDVTIDDADALCDDNNALCAMHDALCDGKVDRAAYTSPTHFLMTTKPYVCRPTGSC